MDKPSTNLQSHRYSFTKYGETPPEPTILNDYRQTSVENEDVVGQVLLRLHLRDQQFYCLLTYVLYYRFEGIYAMACFTKGGVDCQISFDGLGFSFVYPFIFLKYRVYFSLVRCCGLDLRAIHRECPSYQSMSLKIALSKLLPYLRGTNELTHWGRTTHICVGNLTIIGSDNGLSPDRRQAIIWTNDGILSIGPLGKTFSEILIGIQTFSFKKMKFKISSAKWRPFCLINKKART